MMLERFQSHTVAAAVKALTDCASSRRFLIADEVGLGKTVCAKAIAAELQKRRGGPLNVVYLCPNLDIAAQNLTKLEKLATNWEKPEDRLSLVLQNHPARRGVDFRIYCYTPDTSLPGWKAGNRTGRAAERDLVARLLRVAAPELWREVLRLERQRQRGGKRPWFSAPSAAPPKHLEKPFVAALREVMELKGKPLDQGMKAWFARRNGDVAELVLRARAALALAALRDVACRPDLLILDEFHRYADLIIHEAAAVKDELIAERHRVHRLLVDELIGGREQAPALLLLSATPYRLQRLDGAKVAGGRYQHFAQLVRFLYDEAERTPQIEAAIADHHAALTRRDDPRAALAAVAEARRALETLLQPIMARTERAAVIPGELFDRRERPAQVEARDLVTFRHLARAVNKKAYAMRGWVQPLWSSVPYPAETLFNYQICNALGKDLPPVTMASEKGSPAHPQLRALVDGEDRPGETLDCSALGLPWLAPTQTWWALGGRWRELAKAERLYGKALLFSRYRGTPAAVSAWLSNETDRQSSPPTGKAKGKFKAQAYLRPEAKSPWPLIALFFPWPELSGAFEPARGKDLSLSEVRREARRALRSWLTKQGFTIAAAKEPARKPWQLALDVEGLVGDRKQLDSALRQLRSLVKLNPWPRPAVARRITPTEVALLADWLLDTPGAILARTMRRHQPGALADRKVLEALFLFSWRKLRPHLGQRYFAGAILGARRRWRGGGYPDALRRAMLEGGFEATLDEHIAVMMLIGDAHPLAVLEQSLVGRAGLVQRRTTRGLGRARVHAAAPYLGADRRSSGKSKPGQGKSERQDKLRSDTLRKAFNSPFWPHVLTTTSIGQEGLDFHVWCDRIIHWDLPRDPVDFEQREGRIARYASLGVRRALTEAHGDGPVEPWQSPFKAIFEKAREMTHEGLGLERWWSPARHKPISITFWAPFSLAGVRLTRLQNELVRYRLALGQPEPQLFEAMIKHFGLSQADARNLAINLSPAVRVTGVEFARNTVDAATRLRRARVSSSI